MGDNFKAVGYNARHDDQPVGCLNLTASALKHSRIGIIGLGLMGGSLALALRGHVAYLLGVEAEPLTRQMALRDNIVDEVAEALTPDLAPVDLLILATPVRSILRILGQLPAVRPDGCGVLDLGSTKRAISVAMAQLPPTFAAIGGHPMCGKESSGLVSATADLYRDQRMVLCRTPRTTPTLESLVLALIEFIGARPIFLDADSHDRTVAAISHLPYLVSAALMRSAGEESQWSISASGFRDTVRLSGTDSRMMIDILLTNRDEILNVLNTYQADLAHVRELLKTGEEGPLLEWLATAQVRYAAYRRFKSAGQS